MRMRAATTGIALMSLLWSSTGAAQVGHVITPTDMRQAVADQAVMDEQNRDAVLGVLHRSETRDLAGRLGLNLTSAENAVATLDTFELANLAESARTVDAQLAGGANTVVISTTTFLLIIIVVILIAR
jgi:hypothetical protein